MDIFKTLPMALAPSYLYSRFPDGFRISVQPGFLTSEGGLLFARTAAEERFTRAVDQDAKLGDVAWEGQLFVPVWRLDYARVLVISSVLLGWLYLDLPQYITPTPGYAPSHIFMKLLDFLNTSTVAGETQEIAQTDGHVSQWIFFAFHVLKVLIIWAIIWLGAINPITFNPIKNRELRKIRLQPSDLVNIGWTGARRATPFEWREENRKVQIEHVGGLGAAHSTGILDTLATAGVYLGSGEGWNTPAGNKTAIGQEEHGKFQLSEDYYNVLYQQVSAELHDEATTDERKNELLKSTRRSGPAIGPEQLKQEYAKRKARGHGTLNKLVKDLEPAPVADAITEK